VDWERTLNVLFLGLSVAALLIGAVALLLRTFADRRYARRSELYAPDGEPVYIRQVLCGQNREGCMAIVSKQLEEVTDRLEKVTGEICSKLNGILGQVSALSTSLASLTAQTNSIIAEHEKRMDRIQTRIDRLNGNSAPKEGGKK